MAEKKEHQVEHSHTKKTNYWMIASVVLAILLLGTLMYGSLTKVSATKAGQIVKDYFSKSQGLELTISSVKNMGSFYEVTATASNGQSGTISITKDGKYVGGLQKIDTSTTASNSNTQTQPAASAPKSDKPSVDVYVMSWCPYGTQIEKGLLPVVTLLKDKIDFKIRWVSYTLHGTGENLENTVQYCIEKNQNDKYLSYLQCFLNNSGTYSGTPNAGQSALCEKQVGINSATIQTCVNKTLNDFSISLDSSTYNPQTGQGNQYSIDQADNQKYGVQGSPTVVINGVQVNTNRSPAALLSTICSAFTTAPSECSTQLSNDSPTPGFSFSSSSGADSSASAVQCAVQ